MDITEEIKRTRVDLENRLRELNDNTLADLLKRKDDLESERKSIEAEIKAVCKRLRIGSTRLQGGERKEVRPRSKRMTSDEIQTKILAVLSAHPEGLSQKAIEKETDISYQSVINFVNRNGSLVRTQGDRKSKRVFLIT